jgi:hypothetical protein
MVGRSGWGYYPGRMRDIFLKIFIGVCIVLAFVQIALAGWAFLTS